MNKHKILIISCVLVMFLIVILEIIGLNIGETNLNAGYIIQTVIFSLWLGFAPIAYYTYFRLLKDKDLNDFKFYNLAIHCDSLLGIFFIPILLAPFLLIDYIKFFKRDYNYNKLNKN